MRLDQLLSESQRNRSESQSMLAMPMTITSDDVRELAGRARRLGRIANVGWLLIAVAIAVTCIGALLGTQQQPDTANVADIHWPQDLGQVGNEKDNRMPSRNDTLQGILVEWIQSPVFRFAGAGMIVVSLIAGILRQSVAAALPGVVVGFGINVIPNILLTLGLEAPAGDVGVARRIESAMEPTQVADILKEKKIGEYASAYVLAQVALVNLQSNDPSKKSDEYREAWRATLVQSTDTLGQGVERDSSLTPKPCVIAALEQESFDRVVSAPGKQCVEELDQKIASWKARRDWGLIATAILAALVIPLSLLANSIKRRAHRIRNVLQTHGEANVWGAQR
jgi:hypothetical protein